MICYRLEIGTVTVITVINQEVFILAKGEKNAERISNETAVERQHRMRGVVVASPENLKGAVLAPSPDQIHKLLNNKGGNPPCFATAELLAEEVEKYFMSLMAPVIDDNGVVVDMKWVGKPTLAGLATFLGCSRQTIWEYSKSDEKSYVIKNAKNIIAGYAESAMLDGGNPAAYINYMLNLRMETPWIADEKTIKLEPVLPDDGAKSADEITAFLDDRALPEGKI